MTIKRLSNYLTVLSSCWNGNKILTVYILLNQRLGRIFTESVNYALVLLNN